MFLLTINGVRHCIAELKLVFSSMNVPILRYLQVIHITIFINRAIYLVLGHEVYKQQSLLVKSFLTQHDMKPHATIIFQDTVNSLALCIQSLSSRL